MILFCLTHHWQTDEHRFALKNKEAPQPSAAEKTESSEKGGETFWDPSQRGADAWQGIEKEHGVSAYRQAIRETVNNVFGANEGVSAPASAHAIVEESVRRYEALYEVVKIQYFTEVQEVELARDRETKRVMRKTQRDLDKLRNKVEQELKGKQSIEKTLVARFAKEHKEADEAHRQLEESLKTPLKEAEAKSQFRKYIREMGDRYFYPDWVAAPDQEKGYDTNFTVDTEDSAAKSRYRTEASVFQERMQQEIRQKLNTLYAKGQPSLEQLAQVKREIDQTYQAHAHFDGNGDFISPEDLKQGEKLFERMLDEMATIPESSEQQDLERLIILYKTNPEAFRAQANDNVEMLFRQARKDGREGALIELANEIRQEEKVKQKDSGKKPEKPFTSVYQAQRYLKAYGLQKAEESPKEAVAFISRMDRQINGEFFDLRQEYSPEARKIRDQMMAGAITAPAKRDRVMVNFLRESRKDKVRTLESRRQKEKLLTAIKTAKEKYQSAYDEKYGKRTDEKAKEKYAYTQALILIAHEAEWMLNNYSHHPRLAEKDLARQLEEAKVYEGRIHFGKPFKRPFKRAMRSAASMGGFNGRDLGLTVIKVMAAGAIPLNFLNSYKEAGGTGLEKFANGVALAAQNPTMYIAGATMWGADKLQRNPQMTLGRLIESGEYRRLSDWYVTPRLNEITEKVPVKWLKRFLGSEQEMEAYLEISDRLSEDELKNLLKEVKKRRPHDPVLTVDDLAPHIPDPQILATLRAQESLGRNRTRYLFYQSFLNSDQDPLELWQMSSNVA